METRGRRRESRRIRDRRLILFFYLCTARLSDLNMPKIVLTYAISAFVIFFSSSLFTGGLDIATHDTYFVIDSTMATTLIATTFLAFALTIWILHAFSKPLSSWLSWTHFGITIVSLLALVIIQYWTTGVQAKHSSFWDVEEYNPEIMNINDWVTIIALIIVFAQTLFVTNIVRALVLKNPPKR